MPGSRSPTLTHGPGSRQRLMTSMISPRNSTSSYKLTDSSIKNYGLQITLDSENRLCLQFCPDHNLHQIHPNSYAPAALENVRKLGGGGSGVAVFAGHHEDLGDVVMKHGSDKDLSELFALSTIAQELKHRAAFHPVAALHLQQRIPAFRLIYISPHHLSEKRKEMWNRLREISRLANSTFFLPPDEQRGDAFSYESPTSTRSFPDYSITSSFPDPPTSMRTLDEDEGEAEESFQMLKSCSILEQCQTNHTTDNLPIGVEISQSGTVSGHRNISIVSVPAHQHLEVKMQGESLMFEIPEGQFEAEELPYCKCCHTKEHSMRIRILGDGYKALQTIYEDLHALMKRNRWKCTLGQKLIGGEHPQTGNEWLYSSGLKGRVLDNLVTQKIQLVRDLVRLTTREEQNPKVLESIQAECMRIERKNGAVEAEDLSHQADTFVGSAIRKNFRTETGRLPVLLEFGKHFREHLQHKRPSFLPNMNDESVLHLFLTPEEEIPAFHLGHVTEPGALLADTFDKAPMEPTILDSLGPQYWQKLLSAAVNAPQNNTMVRTRLWTCGLADAGLHNLFCSDSRVWLFDLGEPQLTSVPGFLTKFLFSFVHTLGMQEPESGSNTWVRRFDPIARPKKLKLTSETSRLLSEAYGAFAVTLDRIVAQLFDGDDSVRWLLLQYVSLQLVSDASFCLQKWSTKGGGRTRDCNHQEGLEKWLWRALWDIYMACDINCPKSLDRLKVLRPQMPNEKSFLPTARERQLALIKELALESTSQQSNEFHLGAWKFRAFINAGGEM